MCIAVPFKIINIKNGMAIAESEGVKKSVSLMLINKAKIGQYILIHAGFAIKIINKQAALKTISLLKKSLKIYEKKIVIV